MSDRGARAGRFLHGGAEHAFLSYPSGGRALPRELTPAESAVVELVVRGVACAEIARIRRVSPRTVANQLASVYRKLGVTCRASLVRALHE